MMCCDDKLILNYVNTNIIINIKYYFAVPYKCPQKRRADKNDHVVCVFVRQSTARSIRAFKVVGFTGFIVTRQHDVATI